MGVLDGVRVVAFTHFAAGPIAAQYLGALGADVIKVESPGRDLNRYAVRDPEDKLNGTSPYFLSTNRNQRCIVLNLKSAEGKEVAGRLVQQADVVLENFRPGVLERLGFGYEDVKAINPKAVYCSFSAYDPTGPSRDKPGQDLLIQALSGLASLTGGGDGPPVPVGAYLIDGFTALQGVIGILSALRHRDTNQQGQWVRVDMMSTALYMVTQEASYIMNADGNPKRSTEGIAHVHQSAPYGVYETRDGPIALSVFGSGDTMRRAAEALGVEEEVGSYLSEHGLKVQRDEIAGAFGRRLRSLSRNEATALLSPTGIWVVPVRSVTEALEDPAIVASDIVKEFKPAWAPQHRVVVEPLTMSETPLCTERPAPDHGEHTVEILTELGYSSEETRTLIQDGAAVSNG